jgi:peptide-methionine (S)-S-oxide reductase
MAAVFPSALQLERARASRDAIAGPVETPVIANARFYLAEDYHQKYYLRHDRVLMAELASYSSRAFTDSTVAARLNSYVAGHGSAAQLEAELDQMALAPASVAYLRSRVRQRRA